ncbi:hypothetical protein [Chlamydia vaughanii]|uniref:hypothetical protein n=1 Tax=Chlamydia vaughanii TaxID=3112552 RepID=UPI0032B16649
MNINLQIGSETSPITTCLCFPQSRYMRVFITTIFSVVSIILITLGFLNLAGAGSFWLFTLGCAILGLVLAGVTFAIVDKFLEKPTPKLPKVIVREVIPPPTEEVTPLKISVLEASMDYVKNLLEKEKINTSPREWKALRAPMNEDISYLATLRHDKFKEIQTCLRVDSNNRFNYPDVPTLEIFNTLATEYLQTSVVLGMLVLEELPQYLKEHPECKSYVDVLLDSSYCEIIYHAGCSYCLMRFLHLDCKDKLDESVKKNRQGRFYEQGTVEGEWRELYNTFCKALHALISREEQNRMKNEDILVVPTPDEGPQFKNSFYR